MLASLSQDLSIDKLRPFISGANRDNPSMQRFVCKCPSQKAIAI